MDAYLDPDGLLRSGFRSLFGGILGLSEGSWAALVSSMVLNRHLLMPALAKSTVPDMKEHLESLR